MKSVPSFGFALALACLVGSASGVQADVTVEMTSNGSPGRMVFTPAEMRVEESIGSKGEVFIFDSQAMTFTILHPEKKTYQKIDKAFIASMSATVENSMDDMMKMMEEQLKALPPEQRKVIEEQMKKAKGGGMPGLSAVIPGSAGAPQLSANEEETYEAMGDSKKINGFSCKGYIVKQNGTNIGEVWTASLKDIGVDKDDLAIFGKFTEFGKSMPGMEKENHRMGAFNPFSNDFMGVPILQIETKNGVKEITEITSIKKGKTSPDLYTVPAGFKEESFMNMPAPR